MTNKIREIRQRHGITQEELAAASGISRATIVKLERDKEAVTTTKTLSRLAAALGVTIDDIFFNVGD